MTDSETFDKAMLLHELAGPATAIKGLAGLKTRYRPLVCPLGLVLEKIDPGAKVYDVGCGTGALLYLAIRLRHAQLAHGGDVSEDVVHASSAFARHFTEFHVSRLRLI
jgi:SAM-dependent methyltransferase